MHLRQLKKALDHEDVRELGDAVAFAEKHGKPLNTSFTIHPNLLTTYPADLGRWVSQVLLNKLRIWCDRHGFGYFTIWVRESYEGNRREHLHILIHVPEREQAALLEALHRWLPGEERVVKIGKPEYKRDRFGRRTNKALTYMLKQMTPQARFALEGRVRRENKCRDDHAPVAAVLGRRCGVSRSLNRQTRQTLWARAGEALGAARVKGNKQQAA
jgi:hypothetical protein